jgi:hypothetical protein
MEHQMTSGNKLSNIQRMGPALGKSSHSHFPDIPRHTSHHLNKYGPTKPCLALNKRREIDFFF